MEQFLIDATGELTAKQLAAVRAAADGDIVRVGTKWMVEGRTGAIFASYASAVRWVMEHVDVPAFEAEHATEGG